MSAGTRYSASHPILAIRSCFNLEGYSVGVVLRFVGFGPPLPYPTQPPRPLPASDASGTRVSCASSLFAA